MADRGAIVVRPIWMKQAEEAKLKSEAEKAAAAKAAFDATFKDVDKDAEKEPTDDDSETEDLKDKPVGPVDPAKCSAAGAGIAGGAACAPASFAVVTKDSDGRRIQNGGAQLKVTILPGVGVGGSEQEGMVKDQGDGTYTVTYVVSKRGNYMVHVDCNGKSIMGSPFPVFFSAGTNTTAGGLLGMPASSPFPNLVNQTMPNMPNYSGSVSGAFPGLLGMIPGIVPGASGGAVLPGIGASLGEVCRDYLSGRCLKTDCKFSHPPHNLLMAALAATTTMGTLSQMPMAPSAAAMAAAQAIVAAQALQAHAAQVQAQAQSAGDLSASPNREGEADTLKKTLQVSNLSPLLTVEQLKQLFSYCGTVVECSITDSKHFAYIGYSKPEEATAALALNNMDVGGRPLNVEMAKSLPLKPSIPTSSAHQSSLPMVMQQAVAMQQMQFQQALIMQQTMASQQAASRAATMKSATEMASARAAEISKMLKPDGNGNEEKESAQKSRSPSTNRHRSKSGSRSPIKYRRSHRRSLSSSPPIRYPRERRSRSPLRSRYHTRYRNENHRPYRDPRGGSSYMRHGRREHDRSRDLYSSISRRNRSRSTSPRARKSYRAGSRSPKHRRDSVSPRARKLFRTGSASPKHRRESKSSPRRAYGTPSHHTRRSSSLSADGRRHSDDTKVGRKSGKLNIDDRKSAKTDEEIVEQDEDARDSREDRPGVSATLTQRSLILPLDETVDHGRDLCGEEESKPDYEDPAKTDAASKDRGLLENDSMDYSNEEVIGRDEKAEPVIREHDSFGYDSTGLREDKRAAYPSKSKDRKSSKAEEDRTSCGTENQRRHEKQARSDGIDCGSVDFCSKSSREDKDTRKRRSVSPGDASYLTRYEKLKSKHKKPDKTSEQVRIGDDTDVKGERSIEPYSEPRTHKRITVLPDDGNYRNRHDKSKSDYKEPGKTSQPHRIGYESTDLTELRRMAEDYSDSSKRRSLSPEDAKCHSKHNKSKSEYRKPGKTGEHDRIGDDSKDLRKERKRTEDYSDSRIHRRRSVSPEDAKYPTRYEKSKLEYRKPDNTNEQDRIGDESAHLRDKRRRIEDQDHSESRIQKRRSLSPADVKYRSRDEKSKLDNRKSDKTGQHEYFGDDSRNLKEERWNEDYSGSRTHKRRSVSPDDGQYLDRYENSKSDYRKPDKIVQQKGISDGSREDRRRVEDYSGTPKKRSVSPEDSKYLSRHEKSMLECRKPDNDSRGSREDRRRVDNYSELGTHKKRSASPEDTKYLSRHEKSKLEYGKPDNGSRGSRKDRRRVEDYSWIHKKRSMSPEDTKYLSRHEKSKLEYRKPNKMGDQVCKDDSRGSRKERRAEDYTESGTQKTRSVSPEDTQYRSRYEKSISEYKKPDKMGEEVYTDDSMDLRGERRIEGFSELTHKRNLREYTDEMGELVHMGADSMDLRERRIEDFLESRTHKRSLRECTDYDSINLREDRKTSDSSRLICKRDSISLEAGSSRGTKEPSKHEMPKLDYGKLDKPYPSTNEQDYDDRRIADSLKTLKRNSMPVEDDSLGGRKESRHEKSELKDTESEKTGVIIWDKDSITKANCPKSDDLDAIADKDLFEKASADFGGGDPNSKSSRKKEETYMDVDHRVGDDKFTNGNGSEEKVYLPNFKEVDPLETINPEKRERNIVCEGLDSFNYEEGEFGSQRIDENEHISVQVSHGYLETKHGQARVEDVYHSEKYEVHRQREHSYDDDDDGYGDPDDRVMKTKRGYDHHHRSISDLGVSSSGETDREDFSLENLELKQGDQPGSF